LLDGAVVIRGKGLRVAQAHRKDELYAAFTPAAAAASVEVLAIPYFANANRGPTDMTVWIADTLDKASQ
jgi:DUF1680 family protein